MARPGSAAGLRSLYNGNIGAMSVNLSALKARGASVNSAPLLYNYQYDQLNRLVSLQAYQGLNTANNQWSAITVDDYAEAVSYDPNGNIRSYTRNGAPASGQPLQMDQLSYEYPSADNRLIRVGDAVGAGNYGSDIDDQPAGNYSYDAIGNMTGDAVAGITAINWTVYGKKASIDKSGSLISYGYDGAGNRIHKMAGGKQTVYVRDASGNTMSVYEYQGTGPLKQTEQWMYGSSRLGVQSEHQYAPLSIPLSGGYGSASVDVLRRGEKFFEVSNHLGNVLATVSDRKLAVDAGSDGTIDYYKADVVSAQDYYPFGMLQPARSFEADDYRYGFNGKENDNDIKGQGNQQDYGMRIYDPRLGRFLSVDPLYKDYPWNSTYAFAENSPIKFIDLDGEERFDYLYKLNANTGTAELRKINMTEVDANGNKLPLSINYSLNGRNTTFERINQFNNRAGNDPFTNASPDKLFGDYRSNNGKLPDSYYKEYGQFLFGTAISQAKSNGSDELMSMSRGVSKVINSLDNEKGFGGGKFSSVYHAYENLVGTSEKQDMIN